jgi:inorganic pyrophosphatase
MACGCQDKENDTQIIAEIERRKNSMSVKEFINIAYTMETDICHFISGFDETEIQSIIREEHGWTVNVLRQES